MPVQVEVVRKLRQAGVDVHRDCQVGWAGRPLSACQLLITRMFGGLRGVIEP